jgi:hypothetical protein
MADKKWQSIDAIVESIEASKASLVKNGIQPNNISITVDTLDELKKRHDHGYNVKYIDTICGLKIELVEQEWMPRDTIAIISEKKPHGPAK